MTKNEFISAVAENAGKTKKDTKTIVNAMLDTVVEILENGDDISFIGFGKFYVKDIDARPCRNPQTGEMMMSKAHKSPKFKFSNSVKNRIR